MQQSTLVQRRGRHNAPAYTRKMVGKPNPTSVKQEASAQPTASESTGRPARVPVHLRVGVSFPVTRIRRYMKERGVAERVSVKAAIAVASTLEVLCSEMLELAGDHSKGDGRVRIKPRHITLAVRKDGELEEVVGAQTHIAMGGVVPYVNPAVNSSASKESNYLACITIWQRGESLPISTTVTLACTCLLAAPQIGCFPKAPPSLAASQSSTSRVTHTAPKYPLPRTPVPLSPQDRCAPLTTVKRS